MDNLTTQRIGADDGENTTVCLPAPPLEFGRYELLKELGKGGTGVVWLALDRELGAKVALKTLREEMTSEPNALRELKDEVILNRSLAHPNIVKTFDFVTNGRASAISMEFVDGTNLHRLKTQRSSGFFETEDIGKWVAQLCGAMDYAHGQRVVHRDLKPANLLIDAAGAVKVVDFGIGRAMADTVNRITRSSCGTPPFMSPQQTMGERAVPSDDIYSIGATIYDLLTGDPPFFRGAIREQTLAKVAPPMTERRRELGRTGKPIPAAWEAAVAAALSKESNGRPASASALRGMLEGPAKPIEIRSSPRRSRVWFAVGSCLAALGAAACAYWLLASARVETQPAPAQPELAQPSVTAVQTMPKPEPSPSSPPAAVTPVDRMVTGGHLTHDEGALVRRALAGQQGEFERALAERLVYRRTLSPANWRNFSGLVAPPDPIAADLRPLFQAGLIRENEFGWLADALAGTKGETERSLAVQFVYAREVNAAQWRERTALYPPPPPDPVAEKLKPWSSAGLLTGAERDWLAAALVGKKDDTEGDSAHALVDAKSVTLGQWRARTALPYPVSAQNLQDPGRWPPALDLPLNATTTLRLLRVDPGTFQRGTPADEPGRRNNEPFPSRAGIEQPFFLGVYEVTQSQFMAVMPRNPSYWRGHADWPIDQVDWHSLTGRDGFLERLNRDLVRRFGGAVIADIPTNDEWEYSCRAGTQGPFYRDGVPITDLQRDPTLDMLANYNRSDAGSPQSVGSYAPNAWGFYDMLGNVSEWCRDRFIRGGSWQSNAAGCRIGWQTQSNSDSDNDPSPDIGFRLVLRARASVQP